MTEGAFKETDKIAGYGPYGSYKTLQIGHLIEEFGADNVAIISAESGLSTIKSLVAERQVRVVHTTDEMREAYDWVKADYNTPSHWVCIDGGSRVMSTIANEHFKNTDMVYNLMARRQPVPTTLMQYGRFISVSGERLGIDTMSIYGKIGRDSENLLNAWLSLGSNLYVNYLEDMTGTANREKVPPYGPDVPGKVGLRAVMSSFDYVIRLSQDSKGRCVALTKGSPMYLARTREDQRAGVNIPADIVDFNLAKFVGLITGEK
jgi:hypothetical protein